MARFKGKVEFDSDKCKSCGLCVSVCPVSIITIDDMTINRHGYSPAHVDDEHKDDCIGCGRCALICPDVCITVWRERVSEEA
jgi:2-oxoglutarate ferredoxin oxidoreductase subunit delta